MEPNKLYAREEYSGGTSGSESSWTRYIGSEGIQQANNGYGYVGGGYTGKQGHRKGSYNGFGDECESDDSMASDASSGPSTHYEGSLEVGCSPSYPLKQATTTTTRSSKEKQKAAVYKKQMKHEEEESVDVERHQARSSCSKNMATSSHGKRGVKVRKSK